MRICFLGDGNSVHIRRWIDYFKSRKHEVHLVTFSNTELEGIIVHKVGEFDINSTGGNWQYLKGIGRIRKIVKKISPDIVNAHYVTSYGFLGALTGFKPLVVSAWGSDILVTPKRNSLYKWITEYALNKSQLITSDSKFMTNEISKLSDNNCITVPMGVEERLCYSERIEVKQGRTILSLRTVDKNSNIDVIVKAFADLVKDKDYADTRLIITNTGSEMKNIEQLVTEYGVEKQVELKGFVNREELINMLLSSNLYISIPTSDSTSVTLLEAMACGIVSIVSDIPANNEWIEDGMNGLVLKDNNWESLKEQMKKGLSNEIVLENSKNHNRQFIIKNAIWEDNMKFVEDEYKKLI